MSSLAPIEYDVVSLVELRAYPDLFEHVVDRLRSFRCARSKHLQDYANGGFWKYEQHQHSRTYVFLTPDGDESVAVPAFFSVGKASLDFSAVTRSTRQRLAGGISVETTGAYLIAELARCDSFTTEQLPGNVILREALDVIHQARRHIAGRYVLVDSQEVAFRRLYEPAGFRHLKLATPPKGMDDKQFVTSVLRVRDPEP